MAIKSVGIFIINYNGTKLGDLLFKCIDSVLKLEKNNIKVDIWFVDNGSSDGSLEVVQAKYGDNLKYIRIQKNLGYGGACNYAFMYTKNRGYLYNYIIFMNSDLILRKTIISELLNVIHKYNHTLQNNFIASVILINGFDKKIDYGGFFIDDVGGTWSLRLIIKDPEVIKKLREKMDFIEVPYVDGAFLFIPSSVFEQIGMFNSKLFLYYEDVELCLRAITKNVKPILFLLIGGVHFRSATTSGSLISLYFHTRNKVYTIKKYLHRLPTLTVLKILFWYFMYPLRLLEIRLLNNNQRKLTNIIIPHLTSNIKYGIISYVILKAIFKGVKMQSTGQYCITFRTQANNNLIIKLNAEHFLNEKKLLIYIQNKIREYIIKSIKSSIK